MIMRGLFGLALVALFMPHDSGLSFSRSANAASIAPSEDWAARDSRHTEGGCGGRENSCAGALGMWAELQAVSMRSVSEVKADIEEAQRERALLQTRRDNNARTASR